MFSYTVYMSLYKKKMEMSVEKMSDYAILNHRVGNGGKSDETAE